MYGRPGGPGGGGRRQDATLRKRQRPPTKLPAVPRWPSPSAADALLFNAPANPRRAVVNPPPAILRHSGTLASFLSSDNPAAALAGSRRSDTNLRMLASGKLAAGGSSPAARARRKPPPVNPLAVVKTKRWAREMARKAEARYGTAAVPDRPKDVRLWRSGGGGAGFGGGFGGGVFDPNDDGSVVSGVTAQTAHTFDSSVFKCLWEPTSRDIEQKRLAAKAAADAEAELLKGDDDDGLEAVDPDRPFLPIVGTLRRPADDDADDADDISDDGTWRNEFAYNDAADAADADDDASLQGSLASLAASLAASTDSYDLFSVAERAKYFGVSARHAFMSRYALASSNIHSLDSKAGDDDDAEAWVGEGGRSPRQDYLRRLARRNLLPWPAMMRRPNNPHSIDITGLGMGDAIVVHLAAVLERLPHVSTISVRNNRLTDVALLPLVQAVTHMPGITALDISENKMDDSAHEMLHYLGKPDCALRKLTLIASDIDDWECGSLCEALKVNKSLTDLNLSKNLIGRAEELNIVQPDLITGGEAIAEMLEVNDKITSLDLSWNFIRHESAQAIGKALRSNRTLSTLILAQNKFDDRGSQYIGQSLADNDALTSIDISYNNVTPAATMVIANALKTNQVCEVIRLDGNPIGKRGAEALLAAMRRNARDKHEVLVSMKSCDVDFPSPELFNPLEPSGHYVLDMEEPYSIMVAAELTRLANTRNGANFKSVRHRARGTPTSTVPMHRAPVAAAVQWQPLCKKLVEALAGSGSIDTLVSQLVECVGMLPHEQVLNRAQRKLRRAAEKTGGGEKNKSALADDRVMELIFQAVFEIIDVDGSETIDAQEMTHACKLLGVESTLENAVRIIATYDVDNSGVFEEAEFTSWIMGRYLKKPNAHRGHMIDPSTGVDWVPPQHGTLVVDFFADPMPPGVDSVGTDVGIDSLCRNIQQAPNNERQRMFDKAVLNSDIFLTSGHAQKLLDECCKGLDKLEQIIKILPQMANAEECLQLVETNLSFVERVKLCVLLGNAYGPIMGMTAGHYHLDMKVENDRLAAKKMAEANNRDRMASKNHSGRRDTSQKADWENFRNETFNQKPIDLSPKWFVKLPNVGQLSFDYVATERPSRAVKPMSARRFDAFYRMLGLHQLEHLRKSYRKFKPNIRKRHTLFFADMEQKAANHATKEMRRQSLVRGRRMSRLLQARAVAVEEAGDDNGEEDKSDGKKAFTQMMEMMAEGDEDEDEDEDDKNDDDDDSGTNNTAGGDDSDSDSSDGEFSDSESEGDDTMYASPEEKRAAENSKHHDRLAKWRDMHDQREALGRLAMSTTGHVPRPEGGGAAAAGTQSPEERAASPEPAAEAAVPLVPRKSMKEYTMKAPRASKFAPPVVQFMGYEMPHFIMQHDVVNYWRDYRACTHDQLDYLGKERDHANGTGGTGDGADATGKLGADTFPSTAPPNKAQVTMTTFGVKQKKAKLALDAAGPRPGSPGGPIAGAASPSPAGSPPRPPSRGLAGSPEPVPRPASPDSVSVNGPVVPPPNQNRGSMFAAIGSAANSKVVIDADEMPTPSFTIVYWKLLELKVALTTHYLSVDQALKIMSALPRDDYARVQALTIMLARVVDLENVHKLVSKLTPKEEVEAYHRMGILNLMNPMEPDRYYTLDMRSREEREACKILVKLAVEEPGENWTHETYAWTLKDDPIPGWVLPLSWTIDENETNNSSAGPRHYGKLCLYYSSVGPGCAPVLEARRDLVERCLVGTQQQW